MRVRGDMSRIYALGGSFIFHFIDTPVLHKQYINQDDVKP